MRQIRVLVLAPDFSPGVGGIQLLVDRLVGHWPSFRVRVLTTTRGAGPRDGEARHIVRRVDVGSVASGRVKVAWLTTRAIVEACRFRPDVVLSSHIVMAPAAWAILRLLGTPYLQQFYGMEITARPRLARFAVRHAEAAIAISRYTASLVTSARRSTPLYCVPPGVDVPASTGVTRSHRPLIVTVSRIAERYKGHDVMLRALPLVRARVPGVQWVVVGDGPLRPYLESTANILGVGNDVVFLGAVDDVERDRWLDAAQVFAMPSRLSATGGGEGFGIAYLEAAAHNLPVVAGNVGGTPDAVVDGITGVLVDPTDHVAVADAIADLLGDRSRAEALGRAGAARARTFAWPEVAGRFEQIVRDVTARRAA